MINLERLNRPDPHFCALTLTSPDVQSKFSKNFKEKNCFSKIVENVPRQVEPVKHMKKKGSSC